MNDPFELLAVSATNRFIRPLLKANREQVHAIAGFVCFSKSWQNPVQWSHYAEKHRGLCLGFDVKDEYLSEIVYASQRVPARELQRLAAAQDNEGLRLLGVTKYHHWHYEEEVRSIYRLTGPEADGFEYANFDPDLRLREVIVGANNTDLSRGQLMEVLSGTCGVRLKKVRPSFREFKMVEQRDAAQGLR